jgi:4-hydroxy-3-methylbut-2-enyl diphosphate reductase IspH
MEGESMPYFYFFQKDEDCRWLRKEIQEQFPKYLYEPVEFGGRKVKFYVILDWVRRADRGANLGWVKQMGGNVVQSVRDLPLGAGIFITGYDSDVEERRAAEKAGVPIVDRACPWIKELKEQILALDPAAHRAVVMIDETHMVYQCYKSIIPADAVVVQPENMEERISRAMSGGERRAIALLAYAVFRPADARRAGDFISTKYPNPGNMLDGYKRSLCSWTRQGLLEEIEEIVPRERLGSVWIICSSDGDRSTRSIIAEVRDRGAVPVVVRNQAEIPETVRDDDRIGVLMAPIPMSREALALKETIQSRFSR